MEIVKASEFGIEEQKANELMGNLPQIVEERKVLEQQYGEVIKLDIEDSETSKKAKEVRLLIQKNRTQGINTWHRTAKDFFLKGGQFVDAIKRKEIAVNERMEEMLMGIEKHAENKEKERLAKLQQERVKILSEFVEDANERDLSGMDSEVWEAYLSTKKKAHLDFIEAEKKAEQERQAKIEAERLEQERIRKENERLRKEAEERQKQEAARIEKERKERQAEEAKLKAEREKQEAILRAEREAKSKLEAELKAKEEAEENAKLEEAKRIQDELKKGDAAKVKDLIADLETIKTKYQFKAKKNQDMYSNVGDLVDKVVNYIQK